MSQRISKLREKKEQIDAAIKNLEAREKQRARKRETRRKIVAGGFLLTEMERDEATRQWVLEGLDRALSRSIDRELFALDGDPEGP